MKEHIKYIIKDKNIIRLILIYICSLIGTIGILAIYKPNSQSIGIFIFSCLIICYKYSNISYKKEKQNFIFSIIYSILFSIILVAGLQLDLQSKIIWNIKILIKILFSFYGTFPIIYILINKVQSIMLKRKNYNIKKLSLISFSIIFITSFLVYLAVFPGVWGYDSIFEYDRIINNKVDTNYSVLYTYLLGKSILIGKDIFNSESFGYSIHILLQMLFMSYVSNRVVIYIYKRTKNIMLYVISISFFSLNIFYKILVNSSTQDIFYSAICILLVLNLFKMIFEPQIYFSKRRSKVELILLSIFLCLTRNNGVIIIAITVIFIVFLKLSKKKKIHIISALSCGIIAFYIISGPIYTLIGVEKGGISIREMSSIPTQQLARALVLDKNNMSDETINEYKKYYNNIDELIKWHKINPSISDNLKKQINSNNMKKDPFGYIKLWLEVGVKHKKAYIEAFGMQCYALVLPNKVYPDTRAYHPIVEYENVNTEVALIKKEYNYLPIYRESKFKIYDDFLNCLVKDSKWIKIPVYSSILGQSFYFHTMVLMIGLCIIRKDRRFIIALSPIIATEFIMFFSPVSLYRYIFPVVMAFPLMLMVIMDRKLFKKQIKNSIRRDFNGRYTNSHTSLRTR